jgi:hypothetical protein
MKMSPKHKKFILISLISEKNSIKKNIINYINIYVNISTKKSPTDSNDFSMIFVCFETSNV